MSARALGLSHASFVPELLEPRRLLSAGDVDATFGSGGIATVNIDYWLGTNALIPLDDGNLLVIGRKEMHKIDPSGAPVTSFGDNGVATYPRDLAHDVDVDGDGKILVTLHNGLARFDSDGNLDASFGVNGLLETPLLNPWYQEVYVAAVQVDGTILAYGQNNDGFHVFRLTASGDIDPSFTRFTTSNDDYSNLGLHDQLLAQADGKILFGGVKLKHDGAAFSIVRLNSDGTVDTSFAEGGFYTGDLGRTSTFALDAQGRIVALGEPQFGEFDLVRLTSDGFVDDTFGDAGAAHHTTVFFAQIHYDFASPRVNVMDDGRIVVNDEWHLARLSADGVFDDTFGRVQTIATAGGAGLLMRGTVVQSDGSILVAGDNSWPGGYERGVYRLQGDGTPGGAISLVEGTLTVHGTAAADWIEIGGTQLSSASPLQLVVRSRRGFGRTYPIDDVTLISVDAGAGDDYVWIQNGHTKPSTVWGGDGNDTLCGGAGDDSLSGNAGRDCIDGRGGNDRLAGNGGRDKLAGGDGNDRLYGGSSGDWIDGQSGDDQLWGDGGNDRLTAGAGRDALHGNAGDDSFVARDNEVDDICGDRGTDILLNGDDDDLLAGIESREASA